jgi:hypothetical protein
MLRLQVLDAVLRMKAQNATKFGTVEEVRSFSALLQRKIITTQTSQRFHFPARRG